MTAQSPADFTVMVSDGEIAIHCDTNEREISIAQDLINETEKQISILRARQFLGTISAIENSALFEGELFLSKLNRLKAAHTFAIYLCKHPEALPKPAPQPTT